MIFISKSNMIWKLPHSVYVCVSRHSFATESGSWNRRGREPCPCGERKTELDVSGQDSSTWILRTFRIINWYILFGYVFLHLVYSTFMFYVWNSLIMFIFDVSFKSFNKSRCLDYFPLWIRFWKCFRIYINSMVFLIIYLHIYGHYVYLCVYERERKREYWLAIEN